MVVPTLCRERRAVVRVVALVLTFAGALIPAAAQSNMSAPQRMKIPAMTGILRADTFLHLFGGVMAGMFAASAASALDSQTTIQRYPLFLPAVGLSAALAAGIAKETLDSTGFGDPQWTDLLHTVIGGFVVAGMIATIEFAPNSGAVGTHSGVYALSGVAFAVPIGAALAEEIHLYLVKRRLEK